MAEVTMTQAMALRHLIDNAPTGTPVEVIEAAERLYTAKTKKYDRPKVASKERIANERLVPAVVALVENAPEGTLVNATYINDHLNDVNVRSPQKARVIAEIAIEQGLLAKETIKNRTYYVMA